MYGARHNPNPGPFEDTMTVLLGLAVIIFVIAAIAGG